MERTCDEIDATEAPTARSAAVAADRDDIAPDGDSAGIQAASRRSPYPRPARSDREYESE